MRKLKQFILLLFIFILVLNPFLNVFASNNEQQIKYVGTTTTGEKATISKIITPSELENYFDITLKVKTEEEAREQDMSIVIVMDISNTMNDYLDINKTATKYDAAIKAMESFIKKFASESLNVPSSVTRKIGFVAFNTDAHLIFSLSDCKTQEQADKLIDKMKTSTKKIIKAEGYGDSHLRFTNIEAGLKASSDMLGNITSNKHVIFLSDGFPTTYISSGYKGYDPYTTYKANSNDSKEGYFFDGKKTTTANNQKVCLYGTSYSDRGAIKARNMAIQMKNNNITIHSVGVGIIKKEDGGTLKTIAEYRNQSDKSNFSVIDIEKNATKYEIGGENDLEGYKNWLKNKIGSNIYYDATDTAGMNEAFNGIFENVKLLSEAGEVIDPMGNDIEFVKFYNDQDNKVSFDNDTIKWNLKDSKFVKSLKDNITYYEYELKYRIRLENENPYFNYNNAISTNKKTTLSYVIKDGEDITIKTLDFEIPRVEGYYASLEFDKKSDYKDEKIEGAVFELVHDDDCSCMSEIKHIDKNYKLTASSNSNGKVIFDKVPSGHSYKLHEIETDEYHSLDDNYYNVKVDFGLLTHNIASSTIINNIIKKDLTISKVVKNITTNKSFDFEINANYKDEKLNGTYQVIRNTNGKITNEEIIFVDGTTTFKLKHNESITIKDLPFKMDFNIKELNYDGFSVKYQINDGDIKKFNDNKIKSSLEDDMKIKFINYSGYVMPETGSNKMLILAIIGTFLLLIPILYISVNTFKKFN